MMAAPSSIPNPRPSPRIGGRRRSPAPSCAAATVTNSDGSALSTLAGGGFDPGVDSGARRERGMRKTQGWR